MFLVFRISSLPALRARNRTIGAGGCELDPVIVSALFIVIAITIKTSIRKMARDRDFTVMAEGAASRFLVLVHLICKL